LTADQVQRLISLGFAWLHCQTANNPSNPQTLSPPNAHQSQPPHPFHKEESKEPPLEMMLDWWCEREICDSNHPFLLIDSYLRAPTSRLRPSNQSNESNIPLLYLTKILQRVRI
jgi:hypothetical protein